MKDLTKQKLHTLLGLTGSILLLLLVIASTSPYKLSLVLLLLPSVLFALICFFASRLVQLFVSDRDSIILPIIISTYMLLLSLLASLQQLTWKDSILSAFLLGMGIFYYKRNVQK
jgi:hypothetical protein